MTDRPCANVLKGCRNPAAPGEKLCNSCLLEKWQDEEREAAQDVRPVNADVVTIGTDHSHFYTTRTQTSGDLPKMNNIPAKD